MKKRFKYKKKKNFRFEIILLFFIILIFVVFYVINSINEKIKPYFLNYAVVELNKISSSLIKNAINNVVSDTSDFDNLVVVTKNNDDEIQMVDFNTGKVNSLLNKIVGEINDEFKQIILLDSETIMNLDGLSNKQKENLINGFVVKIPLGAASNNILISNMGPKIPIRFKYAEDISSNITTKLSQYGINSVMFEVIVNFKIKTSILLPFNSYENVFEYNMPLVVKLLQGVVPNYYGGSIIKESNSVN